MILWGKEIKMRASFHERATELREPALHLSWACVDSSSSPLSWSALLFLVSLMFSPYSGFSFPVSGSATILITPHGRSWCYQLQWPTAHWMGNTLIYLILFIDAIYEDRGTMFFKGYF